MPKGTEAPGFGLELFSRMGEASRARRAYEALALPDSVGVQVKKSDCVKKYNR